MQNVTAEQTQRDRVVVLDSYRPPFREVPIEALGSAWPMVARGLRVLKNEGNVPWNEDDVRRRLMAGRAGLYVCDEGFVVLEISEERLSLLPYLNVWLMWFAPQKGMPKREAIIGWLDEMKAEKRCAFLQFESPREGWCGIESGFTPYMTIWRRA